MMWKYRSNQGNRGQAMVETALFMSLIIALWSLVLLQTRASLFEERFEQVLRQNGFIYASSDAWEDWGQVALYNDIRNRKLVGLTQHPPCQNLNQSEVSDAILGTNQAGQASAILYNSTAPTVKACSQVVKFGSLANDPLFAMIVQTVTDKVPTGVGGSVNRTSNSFRGVDTETMLSCFPDINRVVSNSLDPMNDNNNSTATVTAPLPNAFSPPALAVGC